MEVLKPLVRSVVTFSSCLVALVPTPEPFYFRSTILEFESPVIEAVGVLGRDWQRPSFSEGLSRRIEVSATHLGLATKDMAHSERNKELCNLTSTSSSNGLIGLCHSGFASHLWSYDQICLVLVHDDAAGSAMFDAGHEFGHSLSVDSHDERVANKCKRDNEVKVLRIENVDGTTLKLKFDQVDPDFLPILIARFDIMSIVYLAYSSTRPRTHLYISPPTCGGS